MIMTDSLSCSLPSIQRRTAFDELVHRAQRCRICPAMEGRRRILSTANGPLTAQVMLVGEAPGRHGAEQTGIPFAGDVAGKRLEQLLAAADWQRDQVFITNAVLCNPLTKQGHNRRPHQREARNCQPLLQEQIALIDPMLVVALGGVALQSLGWLEPHGMTLSAAGSPPVPWAGRWLAVAYHPGARAARFRSTELQRADFKKLGEWLHINGGSGDIR